MSYEVPLMKLVSSAERSRMEQAFVYATGLRREQFAVNSWGFPFIPIPEQRYNDDRYRLAPKNVHKDFMGHPIYWISPELTKMEENEPEESWCIRMFYLIMSFGLWGKRDSRQWVDYIQWMKIKLNITEDFSEQDYATYHLSNMPKSAFDQLGILDEDQMRIPMTQWIREFEDTMRQCESILDDQLGDFFTKQALALKNAVDIFGDSVDMRNPRVQAINRSGWWMREVHPELSLLDEKYSNSIVEGTGVSFIGDPLDDLINKVIEQMEIMEQSIAVLMVPVIRTATTESEAFSQMLTYYRLGVNQSQRSQSRWDYSEIIDRLFMEYPMRNDGRRYTLEELSRAMYLHYESVWKRLRLAAYNYEALRRSDIPMTTYEELELYLIASYEESPEEANSETSAVVDEINGNVSYDGSDKGNDFVDDSIVDTIVDGDMERLGISQSARRHEDSSKPKTIADVADDDDDAIYEYLAKNAG